MNCIFTDYYKNLVAVGMDVSIVWVGFDQSNLPTTYSIYGFNEYLPVVNEHSRIEFTVGHNAEGYIYLLDKDKRIMARLDHEGKYMAGTKLSLSIQGIFPMVTKTEIKFPPIEGTPWYHGITEKHFERAMYAYAKQAVAFNKDTASTSEGKAITGTTTISELNVKEPRLMKFDPQYNSLNPYPSEANQYRAYYGNVAWLYNPYTGLPRNSKDIGSDVQGHLLVHILG